MSAKTGLFLMVYRDKRKIMETNPNGSHLPSLDES